LLARRVLTAGHPMPRTTVRADVRHSRLAILASIAVVLLGLYWAQAFLIPLALSILIAFLLAPPTQRLERRRVPRWLAVAVTEGTLLLFCVLVGYVVVQQAISLADHWPDYRENIAYKLQFLRGSGGGVMDKFLQTAKEVENTITPTTKPDEDQPKTLGSIFPSYTEDNPLPVRDVPVPSAPIQIALSYLALALSPIGTAGVVVIFVYFMLLQRDDLRDRLIALVSHGRLDVSTQALDEATTRISRYITAQAIINGTYGVAISVGLAIIGPTLGGAMFPSVVLWGLLCAVLRFIPYIGGIISAAFPLIISFAAYHGYEVFIAVAILHIVIEFVTSNLMEPWLYGTSTGMSTLSILVAAAFWTWLWGLPGLLLATPMTVCLVVIGKYVPQLRFFDTMLGDTPALPATQRLYQRLLAGDDEEARKLVCAEFDGCRAEAKVYDGLIVPAIKLAERDHHGGRVTDDRITAIRESVRTLVAELQKRSASNDAKLAAAVDNGTAKPTLQSDGESIAATPAPPPPEKMKLVLVLPANDDADAACGDMLASLLPCSSCVVETLSKDKLASEMAQDVIERKPDVVVISACPPKAIGRVRYIVRHLRQHNVQPPVLVGLWTHKHPRDIADQLGSIEDKPVRVVSTLEMAESTVRALISLAKVVEGAGAADRESVRVGA
jgi:predicted PurR-regulated permease PerM